MIAIDYTQLTKEQEQKIFQSVDYVPLCLHFLLGSEYFNRAKPEALKRFYANRTALQGIQDKRQFLEDDLMEWIEMHKEFKNIIIQE